MSSSAAWLSACTCEVPSEIPRRAAWPRSGRCGETPYAFLARSVGQPVQERSPHSTPLPIVDDSDGGLGCVGLARRAHVARNPNRLSVVIQCDDRLVVVMVHLGQILKLRGTQLGHRGEEAPVPRILAQPLEPPHEQVLVVRPDGTKPDPGAVTEPDRAGYDRHHSSAGRGVLTLISLVTATTPVSGRRHLAPRSRSNWWSTSPVSVSRPCRCS